MNSTNTTILKLLYKEGFSINELSMYSDIDKKSICKNIINLNEKLKDLKLNTIELKNEKYQLSLEPNQWNFILNSKEFMSIEDISEYLFIKFIYKGFINLEVEKEFFQVSRSSIVRYFLVVKNILITNGSNFKYENGKGLSLKEISQEDKNLFCKKLIKIFSKSEFDLSSENIYFTLFKDIDTNKLLENIYSIIQVAEIPMTKFIVGYCFALKVCVDTFGGFKNISSDYEFLEENKKIKKIIHDSLKESSEEYKKQLFSFVLNIKYQVELFDDEITQKTINLIKTLKEEFKVNKIEKHIETTLFKKIYISLFKYENNIIEIYATQINRDDKKILRIIEKSLELIDLKIYFYDKIIILNIMKKIILDINQKEIKNILLLFNETIISNDFYFIQNLKKNIPHINIDIESIFYLQFNYLNCIDHYDLIISEENHKDKSIEKIMLFDYLKVLEKIENAALRRGLRNLN